MLERPWPRWLCTTATGERARDRELHGRRRRDDVRAERSRLMRADLRVASFGIALGFTLSWLGFADYDEVVAMFSLERARLWLAFAIAVGIAAIGLRFDRRSAP